MVFNSAFIFNSAIVKTVVPGLALTVALIAFAGCGKKDATAGGSTASAAGGGEAIFAANCAKCHSINGSGGKRAPDLSHTGGEAEHTAEWLAAFIKDPQSKKPGTRMPAFGSKISDTDIQTLSVYLTSLK